MEKTTDNVNITEEQAQEALNSNKKEAEDLLKDEKKMNNFLNSLESKFSALSTVKEKFKEIPLIVELIRAYMKKEYTEIPIGSIIALVSALVYFLSPVDLIPDAIPVIGYLDDITVLAIAVRFAYTDLEDFKKWKEQQEYQEQSENQEHSEL